MDRRDALKSLVGIPGLTVAPISVHEAEDVALVVFKHAGVMSAETCRNLLRYWEAVIKGTKLEGVKAVVLDQGLDIELVRKRV